MYYMLYIYYQHKRHQTSKNQIVNYISEVVISD